MAQRLFIGNVGLALLANAIATGAAMRWLRLRYAIASHSVSSP
jgi:hypothetical protein